MKTNFYMTPEIRDALKQYNPSEYRKICENLKLADRESGLICPGCGNRGYDMGFHLSVEVEVGLIINNGKISLQVDERGMAERIDDIIQDRYGEFFDNEIICNNCGDLMFISEMAYEECINNGCSGCYMCGLNCNYEQSLQQCGECTIAEKHLKTYNANMDKFCDEMLSQECTDINCGNYFARNWIYNIHIKDINEWNRKYLGENDVSMDNR